MTRTFALFMATLAFTHAALAANPWDGTWKLDRDKSHLTGRSFTYTHQPDGKWLISDGAVKISFAPDGKSYPVLDPDHTMIATMDNDHNITFVNQFKGKTVSTMKETLSGDGKTLTDETSGTQSDGTAYTSIETAKRSGEGTSFFGKWVSTKVSSSAPEIFVIATAADGTVTMSYPASKDSITGKLDGKPMPVTGPRVSTGVTVAYTVASPRRWRYKVALQGKPLAEGYEVLATDGKSFEDTSWAAGNIEEKTTAVYIKQ